MRVWLREPLVHFLLIGSLLFVAGHYLQDSDDGTDGRILVTMTDVERLAALWEGQWNRPPTPLELSGLLEDHIKEEVLFREALAMGLDRDDTVIRRRLAQKVEFLSDDLAGQVEPTEDDLEDWLDAHPESYRRPTVVSFTHVYVNPDARNEAADHASVVLEKLRSAPDMPAPWELGDRFLLPHQFERRSGDDLDRRFGGDFGRSLAGMRTGSWEGPVRSGLGLHLVRIDERIESELLTLDDVRPLVVRDFMSSRRAAMNDAFYQQLRSRYQIEFDDEIRKIAEAGTETGP